MHCKEIYNVRVFGTVQCRVINVLGFQLVCIDERMDSSQGMLRTYL